MDIRNTNFNIISTIAVITPSIERRARKPMRRGKKLSPHHFGGASSNPYDESYHGDVISHCVPTSDEFIAQPCMRFEIFWSGHRFDCTVMANSTSALPRVVSRTLAATPKSGNQHILRVSQPLSQCRRFHRSPPRKEEKLSFRGQLYESTAQRLARERAEEARFAETRNVTGNSTLRLFATTFGI
jgi:hypothetical protein